MVLRNRLSGFFIVLILLQGCAWLDIDVHTYRGGLPVATRDAFILVTRIEGKDPVFFGHQGSTIQESLIGRFKVAFFAHQTQVHVSNERKKLADGVPFNVEEAQKKATQKLDQVWIDLQSSLNKEVSGMEPVAQRLRTDWMKLREMTEAQAAKKLLDIKGTAAYNLTLAEEREYDDRLAQFGEKLQRLIENFVASKEVAIELVAVVTGFSSDRDAGITSNDGVTGRVVGSPIFSRYIAEIADDNDNWSLYNSNSFSAFGGDAQFVAISKGLIEYRQKSLDFDPSAAVAAASTLTKAGLKLTAALATGRFDQGNQSQLTTPGFNRSQIEYNEKLLAKRVRARQKFLVELADILDMTDADGADAADIKNRLTNAANWFEAQMLIPTEE